jgi:hypothetical protein
MIKITLNYLYTNCKPLLNIIKKKSFNIVDIKNLIIKLKKNFKKYIYKWFEILQELIMNL